MQNLERFNHYLYQIKITYITGRCYWTKQFSLKCNKLRKDQETINDYFLKSIEETDQCMNISLYNKRKPHTILKSHSLVTYKPNKQKKKKYKIKKKK